MKKRMGHTVVEVAPRFWTNTWDHPVYCPPKGIEMYVVKDNNGITVDVEIVRKRKIVLRFENGVYAPLGLDIWGAITRVAERIESIAEREVPESEVVLVSMPEKIFDVDDVKIEYLRGGEEL